MFWGFGPSLWLQSLCALRVLKVLPDGHQVLCVCACVCVSARRARSHVSVESGW